MKLGSLLFRLIQQLFLRADHKLFVQWDRCFVDRRINVYLKRGLYLQYFLQAGNKKVRRLNPPGYGSSREVVRHIYFKCLRGLNFQDLLGNRKVVVIKVVDKFVVVSLSKLSLNLLFSKMVFLQKKKQLILDIKLNKMRNLQSFRTLWVVAGQTVLALRLKEKKLIFTITSKLKHDLSAS